MVACRGPIRVWVESGVLTKRFLVHIDPEEHYLCDAHRAERIREYEEEGERHVHLRRVWLAKIETGGTVRG